jgi:hypothetical protein
MISSKVMCDDTYSNKSWSVVAQGMFNLREINQMKREMCNYLEWELTAANPMLSSFEAAVKKYFCEQRQTYPTYPTSWMMERIVGPAVVLNDDDNKLINGNTSSYSPNSTTNTKVETVSS